MASGSRGEDELGQGVFEAASSGDVRRLRELVRFKRFSKIHGSLSWRDPAGRTPLMAAAAKGHSDMVRMLVEEYGVNVEESKFDNITREEFTPLVYAANVGHHKTVEILLKNGAKVDHAYPLHRACYASSSGNLECVKLLIANGADINRKYASEGELDDESTPLAVACEQVCPDIVEYLLQQGADPNIPDKDGNCPMHAAFRAIWNPHSEQRCRGCCIKDGEKIIRMLVQRGARQTKNAMDLTPVMIGALKGNLLNISDSDALFNLPQKERIETLQLMASHFFLRGYGGDRQVGLKILARSLDDPNNRPTVPSGSTCPYGDFKEPVTFEDLEAMKEDLLYLRVVSLMIMERILSQEGQKNYLWQAIRNFADHCTPSTLEGKRLALKALKHETQLELESGFFCGFAVESLYRLLDPNQISIADTPLHDIMVLIKLAAVNISPLVTNMTLESRREAVEYHRYKTTHLLYMLSLYANYPLLSDADKEEVVTLVQQYVIAYDMVTEIIKQLRAEDREWSDCNEQAEAGSGYTGMSVLHVYYSVAARRQPADESKVKERLVTMLLKCGVDPNQINMEGYNALHFLVKDCPNHSDGFRNGIVVPLVEWGCPILAKNHLTRCNVIDDCRDPETKQLLMELVLPSLMKLAARVIRKNRIKYRQTVPVSVANFIDMSV